MEPRIAAVPRAVPVVELGVGNNYDPQGAAQWQVSEWGDATSTWSGREPYWIDITCFVHDVETFTGRERSSDSWQVGTATITVTNATGWADYPPTHIDPDVDPLLTVRPGRDIRVGVAVDGGDSQWLWRGVIDTSEPGYDAEAGDVVRFDCIDAKGDAGRATAAKLTAPVGAGEAANVRVGRVLNAVGWPSWRRQLAPTPITVVATDLGRRAVDLLDRAADSAGGAVFGDVNGNVVFLPRDWQTANNDVITGTIGNQPKAVPGVALAEDPEGSGLYDPGAMVLTEDPAASGLFRVDDETSQELLESPAGSDLYTWDEALPPEVCPSNWEVTFARQDFPNRVIVARQGGTDRVHSDPVAIATVGLETFERRDLETENDVDLDNIALRYLTTHALNLAPRIGAVTVDAGADAEAVELLPVVSPYTPSRVRCIHRAGGRTVFERLMLVTGVTHVINPENWQTRLTLDDAAPYAEGTSGRWETTGQWQVSTWAQPA